MHPLARGLWRGDDLARAANIYPATKNEHFNRWHGGNWQNDTFGEPLKPWIPEDF